MPVCQERVEGGEKPEQLKIDPKLFSEKPELCPVNKISIFVLICFSPRMKAFEQDEVNYMTG